MPSKAALSYRSEELEQAYEVLQGSGLVLIKLDIGYGLIGQSDESLRRIYELKGRPHNNPCVVPGDMAVLHSLCPDIAPAVLNWIQQQAVWTPISVIDRLDTESPLWLSLPPLGRYYSSKDGSVAVFMNAGEFMDALVERALKDGKLLTGSSANLSGRGNCFRPEELPQSLLAGVDLFIDHGVARYENQERLATTMIDLRQLEISRRGVNHLLLEAQLTKLRSSVYGGTNAYKAYAGPRN